MRLLSGVWFPMFSSAVGPEAIIYIRYESRAPSLLLAPIVEIILIDVTLSSHSSEIEIIRVCVWMVAHGGKWGMTCCNGQRLRLNLARRMLCEVISGNNYARFKRRYPHPVVVEAWVYLR